MSGRMSSQRAPPGDVASIVLAANRRPVVASEWSQRGIGSSRPGAKGGKEGQHRPRGRVCFRSSRVLRCTRRARRMEHDWNDSPLPQPHHSGLGVQDVGRPSPQRQQQDRGLRARGEALPVDPWSCRPPCSWSAGRS